MDAANLMLQSGDLSGGRYLYAAGRHPDCTDSSRPWYEDLVLLYAHTVGWLLEAGADALGGYHVDAEGLPTGAVVRLSSTLARKHP